MKAILNQLFTYKTLSQEEACSALKNIAAGKYNSHQIASFITVYIMRSIKVEELEGFCNAMLELCISLDLSEYNPIDLCGTGGDGKNTFNISTLAAFVVAGSGVKVAKHGNYGVSSLCGSSNVLEHLGHTFSNDIGHLRKNLEEANICYLHAPLFHPAMKNVAPIRKEMGVKTFFNMLGPMVNPAKVTKQVVGVYNLDLLRLYSYLFQKSNKDYMLYHSLDGYDEISLTGAFKIISRSKEYLLEPEHWQLEKVTAEQIHGGNSIKEAAQIFVDILKGQGSAAQNRVIIANAALAISCARPELSFLEAIKVAEESLLSKKAFACLQAFIGDKK